MKTLLERKQAAAANARKAKIGKKAKRRKSSAKQPIDPTLTYGFDLCTDLFGIGRSTLRRFVTAGMPHGGAGSQKFVQGADLIAAIVADGKNAKGAS